MFKKNKNCMPLKSSRPYKIMGIDPGTRITGYGIINSDHTTLDPVSFGCIKPPANLPSAERYLALFEGLEKLIDQYQPDAISVETQFVYKNIQSALKLGMARGVVLIAAGRRKIPVFEYAPKQAKRAVAGGAADKERVQRMVQLLLKLPTLPEPEDAADALALAICHAHTLNFKNKVNLSCINTLKAP
jgi:crossover junction endodeoxyribonuclease RuvC